MFSESWLAFCLSITKSVEQIALILALTFAMFLYLPIGGFMCTVSVHSLFSYVKASSSHKETDFQDDKSITHHYCMFEVTTLKKG